MAKSTVVPQSRDQRFAVSVSQQHLDILQAYADAHDKSLSRAIADFLEDAVPLMQSLTKLALATSKRREAKLMKGLRGGLTDAAG